MNTKIVSTILWVLAISAFIGVAYITAQKYLYNQAVDGCYRTGTVQFERDGQKFSGPDGFWYEQCMEEKDLK